MGGKSIPKAIRIKTIFDWRYPPDFKKFFKYIII